MRKHLIFLVLLFATLSAFAGSFSFNGGYIFFDNTVTKWDYPHILLVIGNDGYSSVYEMFDDEGKGSFKCSLPYGWSDATYMAVIASSNVWDSGSWGSSNLKNAKAYSKAYTAGLESKEKQGFKFTPQAAGNDCKLSLTWLGDNFPNFTFSDESKNNCYEIDEKAGTIKFIMSTSSKRFNLDPNSVKKVYVYGSISAWNNADEYYRLTRYSFDGCFYIILPLSAIERPGNSGAPEFLFHIYKTDGTDYTERSHSSWQGHIDSRLLFENNGINMCVAFSEAEKNELAERAKIAKYVAPLKDFDLTKESDQKRISNFRGVPGTTKLFRSYHPYKPDRTKFETEHERMVWVAKNAANAGIKCDLALSGNEEKHAGEKYTCGGKEYTITIPDYYKSIIANKNVLYVGTKNGKTPTFDDAIYHSDGETYAEWIKELVEFVIDDAHPAPFQIHCSLGSDRTGSFCATIAALCGASWEEIAENYEATTNLQIQEFRHRNVMKYHLKNMTGVDPTTCKDLQQVVADHFIKGGYLTAEQIEKFRVKLNDTTEDTTIPADGDNGEAQGVNSIKVIEGNNAEITIYKTALGHPTIAYTLSGKQK